MSLSQHVSRAISGATISFIRSLCESMLCDSSLYDVSLRDNWLCDSVLHDYLLCVCLLRDSSWDSFLRDSSLFLLINCTSRPKSGHHQRYKILLSNEY